MSFNLIAAKKKLLSKSPSLLRLDEACWCKVKYMNWLYAENDDKYTNFKVGTYKIFIYRYIYIYIENVWKNLYSESVWRSFIDWKKLKILFCGHKHERLWKRIAKGKSSRV